MQQTQVQNAVIRIGDISPEQVGPIDPDGRSAGSRSPFGWVKFADEGETFPIIEYSENMPSHLGLLPEDERKYSIEGKNLLQFLPWGEIERFTDAVRAAGISTAPAAIRHHYLRIDNTCSEVLSCIRKEKAKEGKAVYSSVYEDISYRTAEWSIREKPPDLYGAGSTQPPKVFIRTFGYFDIFVDGQAVPFRNKKAKELLALLVDRRGGYLSSSEALGILWEDTPEDTAALGRLRKTAMQLRNTLSEYGVEDILESKNRMRRLNPAKVRCDLYDYLMDPVANARLFPGHYMENYSWGEMTLAILVNGITRKI